MKAKPANRNRMPWSQRRSWILGRAWWILGATILVFIFWRLG